MHRRISVLPGLGWRLKDWDRARCTPNRNSATVICNGDLRRSSKPEPASVSRGGKLNVILPEWGLGDQARSSCAQLFVRFFEMIRRLELEESYSSRDADAVSGARGEDPLAGVTTRRGRRGPSLQSWSRASVFLDLRVQSYTPTPIRQYWSSGVTLRGRADRGERAAC
jgi:hypothetical protein